MSRKTVLATTLLAITLALSVALVASVQAQTTTPVYLQLKYRNGTTLIPLVGQDVTIYFNKTAYSATTNKTGWVAISVPREWIGKDVNMTVWWKAPWAVSYLVNFTNYKSLSGVLNGTAVNCSIYNVNLWTVDQQTTPAVLKYAIVKVLDLNKSKLMYEINVGATGLTGNLMIPAPLNEKNPNPNNPANYYFRLLVYWSPAPSAANVKVFNGTFKYGGTYPGDTRVLSQKTGSAGKVQLNCSVYYVSATNIITQNGYRLSSTGDVFVYACIYSNGTLMSEQARVSNGGAGWFRVATVAYDGDWSGNGRLSSYEFRVYWRWERPSIEYLVLSNTSAFSTISANNQYSQTQKTDVVGMYIVLLDKSSQPLSLTDVSLLFPLYNYEFKTSSGSDGKVDFWSITANATDRYYIQLPMKHGTTVLTYRIKATLEGIPVLDKTFDLTDYATWTDKKTKTFTCNVYWASFNLVDARNKPLKGLAKLTIAYPDYGVSLSFVVMDGVAGKRLPGGTGLTAAIDYKGVSGLKPIAPASFNITEGSTAVTLKFPVYNLKVLVYDWYGKVKLKGLNATMTLAGQTVVGAYNATEASYLFEQLPAGGTYTVNVYTNKTSPTVGPTVGFDAPGAQGKLMGSATVTMPSSDYVATIRAPLYNPTFVVKAADGSDVPQDLLNYTYIVVQANTTTTPTTFVNRSVQITYASNQTRGVCFVGGWKYPVAVYIGGVVVYNGTATLPDPAVTGTVTLRTSLYKSMINATTYSGVYPVPGLAVKYGWVGVNVTKFSGQDLLTTDWGTYLNNFKGVTTSEPEIIAYNKTVATTGTDGIAYLWVPVWSTKYLNFTTIVFGVYTVPGTTLGVPSTAPAKLVIHNDTIRVGISGKLANVTALAYDIGKVKTYAYDFKVKVLNYLDAPLAGYSVLVNETSVGLTGATGELAVASKAPRFYFGNYSYSITTCLKVQEGVEVANPQTVSGALTSNSWKHGDVVTLKFPGALILKALDWKGDPLKGAVVKLYWANGTYAGTLTAVKKTDDSGVATIYMSNTVSYYTVEVWWKGSIVNQLYRLEQQLRFPEGVSVYSYTERMKVYSPKITFVSDLGTVLPAGIRVEVTWPDGVIRPDATDNAGSIMLVQAPIGKYTVTASWRGVTIYSSDLWISSDEPITLKTSVYEVALKFLTKRGTPLAGAQVQVQLPNAVVETVTLDSEGKTPRLLVPVDAVNNKLTIKSVVWQGSSITLDRSTELVKASGEMAFYATNVYELKVSVVGSAGQLLDGAAVAVLKDGYVVASATARGGVATFELLPGDYTIEAAFLGKRGTAKVSMTTDYSVSIPLDVFMVIGNQAFSASEIVLWIVLAIVIVIVLAAIIMVLARIRRKAPAPPTPPSTEAPAKTQ
jgi:hypothetical protein